MKLWRVEDTEGIGLHSKFVEQYNPEKDLITPTAFNLAVFSDWCEYDDDLYAHVPPEEDNLLQENLVKTGVDMNNYLFAFKSAKQMRDYLYKDSWIKMLDKYRMKVAIYWLESGAIMGDYQVLIPKQLKPLQKTPISEYFGIK